MMELLSNPSLKRFLFTIAGAAVVAMNKKLGLGLDPVDIAGIVSMVVAFVGQSAWKEARLAGMDAAAKVTDVKAAVDIINGPAK